MKTLIVCKSMHHGNTEKIARAMAEVLGAEVKEPEQVDAAKLPGYDLIGLGSGIYFLKHHPALFRLIDKLPYLEKRVFIFSTRGMGPMQVFHRPLKRRLQKKGYDIAGEFSCKGFDNYAILKLVGGINKNKPDDQDIEDAKRFAGFFI
jgi:flavodoxin